MVMKDTDKAIKGQEYYDSIKSFVKRVSLQEEYEKVMNTTNILEEKFYIWLFDNKIRKWRS